MTNCIFYTMFFSLFLNLLTTSLKLSQVNRVFTSVYKGMLEACTLTVNDDGESAFPIYDQQKVSSYVNNYLSQNLSKFTDEYSVDISYSNKDGEVCYEECSKVKLTLNAKINTFYKYKKSQTFEIKSGEDL